MSKKHLSLALALVMALSMSVGLFAVENHCDHCTYETYYDHEYGFYSGCEFYIVDYYRNVCVDCGYEWLTDETYLDSINHNPVYTGMVCDGTFWYELTYCSICDETLAYESGYGCGCGSH